MSKEARESRVTVSTKVQLLTDDKIWATLEDSLNPESDLVLWIQTGDAIPLSLNDAHHLAIALNDWVKTHGARRPS